MRPSPWRPSSIPWSSCSALGPRSGDPSWTPRSATPLLSSAAPLLPNAGASPSAEHRGPLCSCVGFAEQEVPMADARPCCVSPGELSARPAAMAGLMPPVLGTPMVGIRPPVSPQIRALLVFCFILQKLPWALEMPSSRRSLGPHLRLHGRRSHCAPLLPP